MTHPGLDTGPALAGRLELDMLAGFIAGLGASVHCLAMCGGIAAAIAVQGGAGHAIRRRLWVLTQAQLARVCIYIALGAAAGAIGWGFHESQPPDLARAAARWLGALALMAAAFSVLDIPVFGGAGGRLAGRITSPLTRRLHHLHRLGPLGLGLAWGLIPCAMVYLATFYAGLTGSPLQGALVMAGFGLGTIPALTVLAAGAASVQAMMRRAVWRWLAAGLLGALAVFTALGVWGPHGP
ncbi:sulfite exporter TauE/SafE family protein [Alkalicaulis satelles]|uniref:Sulfite exporter TauE/SafE family protein n=1 Tax=Alkalicaulis satelles TaxID=2609175 RepID=A0A5M6ZKM3_9PROT|nr:sulfite exporter TauE/SafE family protein [Alkalicaulis satelles]KAA5805369.1 sulfite exporter TauE/SafE family protein [Alkalicaulis satelles]